MAVQWATPGFDEVALGIQLSYVISAVSFLKPLYWLATLFLPLTLCKRWGESVVRRAITLLTYVLNLEPEVRDGVKYNWVMDTEMESLVFVEKRAAGKQRLWVAFTGSTSFYDWARNLMFWHTEDPEIGDKNLQVHFGFKKMVDHAMASRLPRAIRTEVTDCDEMYIVGHSLGGAVAALFTLRLVKDMEGKKVAAQEEATALFGNDRTKWPALSLITYAQPRVGNDAVAKLLDDANLLRINVAGDPVPQVPLWPWNTSCYVHGGRSVWLAPVYDPRPYIVEGEVTTDWLAQLTVALASLWLWFLHLPSFYVWRWSVSGHKAIKELAAVANRAATRN